MYERDGLPLRDLDPSLQSQERPGSQGRERETPGATAAPLELPGSLAPIQRRREGLNPLGASLSSSLGELGDVGARDGGLEPGVRADMESFFGQSFGDVQVERDSSDAARIGARAYTQGNEVHFAPGAYQPGSASGRALIGHELAHVVQQRAGRVEATDRLEATGQPLNAQPGLEREADDLGHQAAGHRGSGGATVQAKPASGSAVAGGGVVQGYFDYDPAVSGNYAMSAGATFESQRLRSGIDAAHERITRTAAGANPGQLTETTQRPVAGGPGWAAHGGAAQSNLPPLHIAHNGMMAIEKTVNEPRVFYADPAVVANANTILAQNASHTRLLADGASIDVPTTAPVVGVAPPAQRNLQRVRPGRDDQQGGIAALDTFGVQHECMAVIKEVIGSAQRCEVLGTQAAGTETPVRTSEPTYEIANALRQPNTQAPALAVDIDAGNRQVAPGQIPQVEARHAAITAPRRARRAARLGINEHAQPEVGEGYVVNSMNTTQPNPTNTVFQAPAHGQDRYLDALQELQQANLALDVFTSGLSNDAKALKTYVWGNHYAGVVARSGPDSITLENYNREQAMKWEVSRIFDELYLQSAEFRTLFWNQTQNLAARDFTVQRQAYQNIQAQGAQLQGMLARARAAHTQLVRGQARKTEMYYFQMYGPGAQSFHAKTTGMTSNAITMRTGIDIDGQRPALRQRNSAKAHQVRLALVNARIGAQHVDTTTLQALRIQTFVLENAIEADVTHAAHQRDLNAADQRIAHDYQAILDQIRDRIVQDAIALLPGNAAIAALPGQPLAAVSAALILAAQQNRLGNRTRHRNTARRRRDALRALRDIATDLL